MPLASLFSTIGNLATGLINSQLQSQQNEHNEWLARQQNQWNRHNWFNAMAYDAPINQVQRLRAAGLNPALVYGNGIENTAPTAPDMVSSQGVAPSIGSPFAALSRDMLQEQLTESQVKLNESAAQRNLADAGLKEIITDINGVKFRIISKTGEQLSEAQLDNLRKSTELLTSTIKKVDSEVALNVLQGERIRKYIDNIMPAELLKIQSETGLNEAQTKQVLELLPYEIMLRKAKASNEFAQAELAKANAKFQKMLNESDQYVKDFVNKIHIDNMGNIVDVAINAGINKNALRVGATELGVGGQYNISEHTGVSSLTDFGEFLGTLGRLFSFIVKP